MAAAVFTQQDAPQDGCHRCLCPQREPKLPPPPLALQPSACEIMWGPFTSEASSPVGLPESSPIGLQRQMLWGIVFPDPQAGESNMGLRTHCSERTSTV